MSELPTALTERPELLRAIYRAVEPEWPREGCGFLFERTDGAWVVLPTINRADDLHRMDPERYPRGAESWFEPDMKPWLRESRAGGVPRLIFHSHPDVGAYFSASDQESAVYVDSAGTPHPRHEGVWHLVVSVRRPGRADGAALFAFDGAEGRFVERARFGPEGEPVHPGG